MPKKTYPKVTSVEGTKLMPDIPAFVYECIANPESDEIQVRATVEATLCRKEVVCMAENIHEWKKGSKLLKRFIGRGPTTSEWEMLVCMGFGVFQDFDELVATYPENFTIKVLNEYSAPFLVYVRDWKDWNDRHNFKPKEYIKYNKIFNAIDVNPDLKQYKDFFKGKVSLGKELVGTVWDSDDETWIWSNPYANSETERVAWYKKLMPLHKIPSKYAYWLYEMGEITLAELEPRAYMDHIAHLYGREPLATTVLENVTFRNRLLAFLLEKSDKKFGDKDSQYNMVKYSKAPTIAKIAVEHGWFTDAQCEGIIRAVYHYEVMNWWECMEKHYGDWLTSKWTLFAELGKSRFYCAISLERFLGLVTKHSEENVNHLLNYLGCQKPEGFPAVQLLGDMKRYIKVSNLEEAQLLTLLKLNIVTLSFKEVELAIEQFTSHFTRVDILESWLKSLKKHLSKSDYKATVHYVAYKYPFFERYSTRWTKSISKLKETVV